jgi:hypothetical protein
MDPAKYFKRTIDPGEIVRMVVQDLHKIKKFKSILFVRTPSTGSWMDRMIRTYTNLNPYSVLYTRNGGAANRNDRRLYTILDHSELDLHIKNLNKRFDLICLDPFHEYIESISDFTLLTSVLSDDGILISHDCFPPKKEHSSPVFKSGWWCGVTYVAFVEIAYNNPSWFYTILDNDNGVGIISKNEMAHLKNEFDREKQQCLIQMNKEGNDATYEYFCENSNELINLIRE